jgi:hypothetical protein
LLLRNVPQLEKKAHRGISLHARLLLVVPNGETQNARQSLLKYKCHAAAGGKQGI